MHLRAYCTQKAIQFAKTSATLLQQSNFWIRS